MGAPHLVAGPPVNDTLIRQTTHLFTEGLLTEEALAAEVHRLRST